MQQYRSDLEGQRFRLERYGSPRDSLRQQQLRDVQNRLDRLDRQQAR